MGKPTGTPLARSAASASATITNGRMASSHRPESIGKTTHAQLKQYTTSEVEAKLGKSAPAVLYSPDGNTVDWSSCGTHHTQKRVSKENVATAIGLCAAAAAGKNFFDEL